MHTATGLPFPLFSLSFQASWPISSRFFVLYSSKLVLYMIEGGKRNCVISLSLLQKIHRRPKGSPRCYGADSFPVLLVGWPRVEHGDPVLGQARPLYSGLDRLQSDQRLSFRRQNVSRHSPCRLLCR